MTILEAVVLGCIQGVFMFVPVSSTAHLVLAQHAMIAAGSEIPAPDSAEMILFDLVVHVGTLVSIAIVFRQPLGRLVAAALRDSAGVVTGRVRLSPLRGRRLGSPALWLMLLGAISVLATAALGLPLKRVLEAAFAQPLLLAGTLAVTGVLLWWTDTLATRTGRLSDMGPKTAAVIGLAQGIALLPGISRSGFTIIAALACGLRRQWAAQYSFFLAIPAILAATALQAIEVYGRSSQDSPAIEVGLIPLAVGFVVAAAVGAVALRLVLALLYRARLKIFSFYLWGFALLVVFGAFEGLL